MPTDPAAVRDQFAAALETAEQSGDAGQLVGLFADDAELHSVGKPDPVHGKDGATQFWADYLKTFESVRSTFTHAAADGNTALLEWASEGKLTGGRPIRYRGVSVLEVADDRVAKFRTYYDTAAFVTPTADPTGAARDQAPAAADAGRPVPDRPRAAVADEQPAPARAAAGGAGGRTDGGPKPGEAGPASG
jgi:ketosteroid isomerase-like protein